MVVYGLQDTEVYGRQATLQTERAYVGVQRHSGGTEHVPWLRCKFVMNLVRE